MSLDLFVILLLPLFVSSLAAHECAPELVARWLGDPTARDRGRLGLDRRARPAPIDRAWLRGPGRPAVLLAAAGPTDNLLLAIVLAASARVTPETGCRRELW